MAKKLKTRYPGAITLEVLEGAYRYNSWIAESIASFIKSPVLEVGAGIGNISSHFISNKQLTLTDIDDFYLQHLKNTFKLKNVNVLKFDISRTPPKQILAKYNSVIAINTLEHIKNHEKALLNLKKVLVNNGRLILLVPAKKYAYNKLDKELGHYRRYEKNEIMELLSQVGFKIEFLKFFNALGLVTWITRNHFNQQNIHLTPRQIAAFDLIVPIIKRIERFIPMPVGISLIAVARCVKNKD